MPTPTASVTGPNAPDDTALRWIVSRLDALARAINVAARSADPIAALAPHRVEIAELRGVARLDAAPPLGAVLDVVGQLAGATPATAPPTTLIQPTLELASRALQEGAAALGAGLVPAADGATVLALAALVRAAPPVMPPPVMTAPAGATLADLLRDGIAAFAAPVSLPDAAELAYRGPSARAAARALRDALERGERAATPAAMDELHDLLRLAEE